MADYACKRCDDTGWVCEMHADRPWEGRPRACAVTMLCAGPGMPCPDCNASEDESELPQLSEGFVVSADTHSANSAMCGSARQFVCGSIQALEG